ncbi:hypothetical protein [Pandoraea sp. NPDC087047]|uniref:hypothetical protein n=1 Tax=Pandoraea sp. NPDC087047 TaxID=3364390 RepID=UPI00380636EE
MSHKLRNWSMVCFDGRGLRGIVCRSMLVDRRNSTVLKEGLRRFHRPGVGVEQDFVGGHADMTFAHRMSDAHRADACAGRTHLDGQQIATSPFAEGDDDEMGEV